MNSKPILLHTIYFLLFSGVTRQHEGACRKCCQFSKVCLQAPLWRPISQLGLSCSNLQCRTHCQKRFFNIYFQSKELMNNKVFRAIYWCMTNCQHYGLIHQIGWNLYQNVLLGQCLNRMCDNMDIWQDNVKGADYTLFIMGIISVQLHHRMFLFWWNPCLCPHNSNKMVIGI